MSALIYDPPGSSARRDAGEFESKMLLVGDSQMIWTSTMRFPYGLLKYASKRNGSLPTITSFYFPGTKIGAGGTKMGCFATKGAFAAINAYKPGSASLPADIRNAWPTEVMRCVVDVEPVSDSLNGAGLAHFENWKNDWTSVDEEWLFRPGFYYADLVYLPASDAVGPLKFGWHVFYPNNVYGPTEGPVTPGTSGSPASVTVSRPDPTGQAKTRPFIRSVHPEGALNDVHYFGGVYMRQTSGLGDRVKGWGLDVIAHSGWTTDDHLNNYTQAAIENKYAAVVADAAPDHVLIMIHNQTSTQSSQTSRGETTALRDGLISMVQRYQAAIPTAEVILVCPWRTGGSGSSPWKSASQAATSALAYREAAMSAGVPLVSLYHYFGGVAPFNGVHPSDPGAGDAEENTRKVVRAMISLLQSKRQTINRVRVPSQIQV